MITKARIVMLASEGCLSSSISFPKEIQQAANDYVKVKGDSTVTELLIAAPTRFVECAGGIKIRADILLSELNQVDLLILPALWRNPLTVINKQRKIIEQLPVWYRSGSILCAVGSASFMLAEAGLLDRRAATTHWVQADLFTRRYPLVKYQKDFLITQSERIYCAASVNSLVDLTIHFIELFYGKACAQHVQANFSPEARSPYSANLYHDSAKQRNLTDIDEDITRLQDWLKENIAMPHNNGSLARLLNLSERALSRRFRAATGQPPQVWLESERISYARELLRKTDLSISEIATESGYPDRNYFSRRFKKLMAMSPMDYRTNLLKKTKA